MSLVCNLKVVALSIRVDIPLLNIWGGHYIYTGFITGYLSADLAGNLQYYFLTIFRLEDVIIVYSIPDDFSYARLSQFL